MNRRMLLLVLGSLVILVSLSYGAENADWVTFTEYSAYFEIKFPAKPAVSPLEKKEHYVTGGVHCKDAVGTAYDICWLESTFSLGAGKGEAFAEEHLDRFVRHNLGTLTRSGRLEINGLECREFDCAFGDDDDPRLATFRFLWEGKLLYVLSVRGRRDQINEEHRRTFFDSFAILGRKPGRNASSRQATAEGDSARGREEGSQSNVTDQESKSPLYLACEKGDVAAVKKLLAQGENVNGPLDARGFTPLFIAAQNGHKEVLELLLNEGADVHLTLPRLTPVFENLTALHMSVKHPNLVEILLKHGADPNAQTMNGMTPVHYAAILSQPRSLQLLLAQKGNPNATAAKMPQFPDVPKTLYGVTPLFLAVFVPPTQESCECARILLEHGADPKQEVSVANLKASPLLVAVGRSLEMAQVLLEHGADANQECREDLEVNGHMACHTVSPLAFAARMSSDTRVVELLLKHKADVRGRDRWGFTVLHDAISNPQAYPIVELLLSRGAEIDARAKVFNDSGKVISDEGCTPLQKACLAGRLDLVGLFLKHGADPEIPGEQGLSVLQTLQQMDVITKDFTLEELRSALQPDRRKERPAESLVAFCGLRTNPEEVDEYIKAAGSPEVRNTAGMTPLCQAAKHGNTAMVERLLNTWHIEVNQATSDNMTTLHFACQGDMILTARVLLNHGADPEVRDQKGDRPIDLLKMPLPVQAGAQGDLGKVLNTLIALRIYGVICQVRDDIASAEDLRKEPTSLTTMGSYYQDMMQLNPGGLARQMDDEARATVDVRRWNGDAPQRVKRAQEVATPRVNQALAWADLAWDRSDSRHMWLRKRLYEGLRDRDAIKKESLDLLQEKDALCPPLDMSWEADMLWMERWARSETGKRGNTR